MREKDEVVTEMQLTAQGDKRSEPLLKKATTFGLGLVFIILVIFVPVLLLRGMAWASERALPWLIDAGQISFAICGFLFLPLCIFRKTRPWAGFGFFVTSYVFGTELLAYSCVVTFAIWSYAGLILGLFLGGIGVVPIALLAALFAAFRHRTQWGLFGDLVFMILLTFGARFLGIYLSTPKYPEELESKVTPPSSPSFFIKHRALSILGWFVALFTFNVLLDWWQNTDKSGLFIFLAAIDRFQTPPELVLSAAAIYGIVSKRQLMSTARLAIYIAFGLVSIVIAFAVPGQKQGRDAFMRMLGSYRGGTIARAESLSPVELFQKASPSVFVVEALDRNGNTAVLGSGVAVAHDFLMTNCHVVQSGASLRIGHGKEKWAARLIQAAPDHDLCGLKPSELVLQPVTVRPSSKLATGERVYAIGAPEGLELTFSEGVISALRESEGVRMIQTSAPISHGSSGGGLFDAHANLVGITTFYLEEGQSLNFALPGEWISGVLAGSTKPTAESSVPPSDVALESRAWIEIGSEAAKKEDYELAANSYRKCTDLKQSDAYRAWFEMGRIWAKAESIYSTSDAYQTWLGSPLKSKVQEAQAKAVAAFEQSIQLKPESPETWFELSREYFLQKKYPQAIAAAREATRLEPHNKLSWIALGLSYQETKSYGEAVDAFQQGLRFFPNDVTLLYVLGEVYAEKGDRDQVLSTYARLKVADAKVAERFFRETVLPQPTTVQPKKMAQ